MSNNINSSSVKYTGKFYKFTRNNKDIYVPVSDLNEVEGKISLVDKKAFVKSYRYNLWGNYNIEELTGTFYKLIKDINIKGFEYTVDVYIPKSDVDHINAFSRGGRRRVKNNTRRNRRRYSRCK